MSAKATQATDERTANSTTNQARHADIRNAAGHYGRPQYKLSYYSEKINARAIATFETRAEAVGYMAVGEREGWMKRPCITYRSEYDHTPSKHYK